MFTDGVVASVKICRGGDDDIPDFRASCRPWGRSRRSKRGRRSRFHAPIGCSGGDSIGVRGPDGDSVVERDAAGIIVDGVGNAVDTGVAVATGPAPQEGSNT